MGGESKRRKEAGEKKEDDSFEALTMGRFSWAKKQAWAVVAFKKQLNSKLQHYTSLQPKYINKIINCSQPSNIK